MQLDIDEMTVPGGKMNMEKLIKLFVRTAPEIPFDADAEEILNTFFQFVLDSKYTPSPPPVPPAPVEPAADSGQGGEEPSDAARLVSDDKFASDPRFNAPWDDPRYAWHGKYPTRPLIPQPRKKNNSRRPHYYDTTEWARFGVNQPKHLELYKNKILAGEEVPPHGYPLKELGLEAAAAVADDPTVPVVVEWCCGADSRMGKAYLRDKTQVVRITLDDDAGSVSGLRKAITHVKHKKTLIWSASPCVGGSAWNYVNKGKPGGMKRFRRHRQEWNRIWKRTEEL